MQELLIYSVRCDAKKKEMHAAMAICFLHIIKLRLSYLTKKFKLLRGVISTYNNILTLPKRKEKKG
jgi:hypothetical protein